MATKIAIDAQTVEERLLRLELAAGLVLNFMVTPEIVKLTKMPIEIENIINAYLGQFAKEMEQREKVEKGN